MIGKKLQEIMDDLESMGYDFRINDLDESLEVKTVDGWEMMTDTIRATIRTNMRELAYGTRKKPSLGALEDACLTIAHNQRYNPITDYLLSLEGQYEPNNEGPYIAQTFERFFDNPDGMFGTWLFRWMVGAINKVFNGGRNPMLVLVGEQRMGKSYLARWLCPIDQEQFFLERGISPDNKDDKLRLADTLVWEVPELGATTKRADVEALKAFITLRNIKERKSYGRHPISKRAACSFIGSVNFDGAGFLSDPTGSTRFLSCTINKIDFSYTIQPVRQLWAEAFWFWKNKPGSWDLTPLERDRQAEINASFEIVSALEEAITHWFDITLDDDDFLTTQEIKTHLVSHYNIGNENGFFRELSRLLHRLGVSKSRKSYNPDAPHLRGWSGIKKRTHVQTGF